MQNSRGGVPMYQENPQYNATINPQLPQGSPAAYGTQVQKEMAGLGDAIGKWGSGLVDYALKQQEKADDNFVMQQENDMRKQLNDLLYDPVNGLMNKKGHNAEYATQTFDDAVEQITQEYMSKVNTPNLQNKFQARVSQWVPNYRTSVARHEGDEVFGAHKLDIDTNIQDRIDTALRYSSAGSASVLYNSLAQNKLDLINILGMSPETADEYLQERYSKGVLQMADVLSARGDTQGLLDLYRATEDKVSADTSSKLAALTGKVQAQMNGIDVAKSYRNNPKYLNPDGTFNAALAIQDYEREHGKGATRTERVFVGGGNIGTIDGLMAAIGGQESGGDYNAENGRTGAHGKYQIMPGNWPNWAEEAGIGSDAPRTPENQEKVARYKLNQYLQQYGPEGAMVAWYSGPANAERWVNGYDTDVDGRSWDAKNGNGDEPSIREYVQQVSARGGSSQPVDLSDIPTQDIEDAGLAKTNNTLKRQFRGLYDWAVQHFGKKVEISGGWRSEANNRANNGADNSHHLYGSALDVNVEMLTDEEREAFIAEAQRRGFNSGGDDFYHNKGTGYHVHLTYEDDGSGGAGHWEERVVSAYNEQEYNEGLKWLKEQGEYSKAEHDATFDNALNDALGKVTSLRMPSEVMGLARSYNLNETDTTRLYKVLLGNRLDLADEQQAYSDRQKERSLQKQAEEDAADAFYAWWNANPNAPLSDVQQTAADFGVSSRFMHSVNNMIAKAQNASSGISWFKSPYNKKVFNNAVSQNGLKGEQISNAMDIVTQKEAEKGSPLTPEEITTIVNKASAETVIYEGKWYEKDIKGRAVDYSSGEIGKNRDGLDVEPNDNGEEEVVGIDEDDFE